MNNRFYELVHAAFGLRSMIKPSGSRRFQMSWKIFSWLLGLRIGIYSITALKRIYSQWKLVIRQDQLLQQQLERRETLSISLNSNENMTHQDNNNNDDDATINDDTGNSLASMKCPLCMDALENPAVTSCGHLYCWNCIVPWAQKQKSTSNSTSSSGNNHIMIKCPVCRVLFSQQSIRPVYLENR